MSAADIADVKEEIRVLKQKITSVSNQSIEGVTAAVRISIDNVITAYTQRLTGLEATLTDLEARRERLEQQQAAAAPDTRTWATCFRGLDNKTANEIVRAMFIFTILIAMVIFGTYASRRKKSDNTWAAIYGNYLPCMVLLALNIIPDACHQEQKVIVQVLVVAVCFSVGLLWTQQNISMGISFAVGASSAGLQWVLSALLCTDACRSRLVATLRKCCPQKYAWCYSCLVDRNALVAEPPQSVASESVSLLEQGNAHRE